MRILDEAFQAKTVTVPVIDAHTHILEYSYKGWYQSFTKNSDVISLMDYLGIDCIVTTPHSMVIESMEYTNEKTLEAAKEYPDRIYGYMFVAPHEGIDEVKKMLEKYSKMNSFIGIKFLPGGYHGTLECDEYDYAMDFAQEISCPVLCHLWEDSPPLKLVEKALNKRPGLKFVAAHQGGGSAGRTDELANLMSEYPNLYLELCGSLFNSYSIEEMVNLVGESRIIYGSDMINLDPRYDLGKVLFSSLDDGIKRKILADNFLELIRDSGMGKINI